MKSQKETMKSKGPAHVKLTKSLETKTTLELIETLSATELNHEERLAQGVDFDERAIEIIRGAIANELDERHPAEFNAWLEELGEDNAKPMVDYFFDFVTYIPGN